MPKGTRSSRAADAPPALQDVPDEAQFYNAVAKYIRGGYQMLERIGDPMQRRAAGFLLTTFQKLNASSTAAIKAALTRRLARLQGQIDGLPPREDDDEDVPRRTVRGRARRRGGAARRPGHSQGRDEDAEGPAGNERPPRQEDWMSCWALIDHIEQESPRGAEEKVLIFTEYRQTQRHLVEELEDKYGKRLRRGHSRRHETGAPRRSRPGHRGHLGPVCQRRRAGGRHHQADQPAALPRPPARSASWFPRRPAGRASTSSSATFASTMTFRGTPCG